MANIIRHHAHLFAWSLPKNELYRFVSFQLFSLPLVSTIHYAQSLFKTWFNYRLIDLTTQPIIDK